MAGAGRAHGDEERSRDAAIPSGRLPVVDGLDGDVAERVDPREGAGELVAHPDRAVRRRRCRLGPSPTGIVAATVSLAGSMRVTVPSRLFATQTAPGPTATASAPLPACDGADDAAGALVDPGHRAARPELVTQTEPPPTATPSALGPTGIALQRLAGAASRSASPCRRSSSRPRRSAGRPRCRPDRCRPGSLLDDRVRLRVDLRDRAVEAVRDPDEAAAEGDPGRAVADLDRVDHDLLRRVDPRDAVGVDVRDPDRAVAGVTALGDAPTGDLPVGRPVRGVKIPTESARQPAAEACGARAAAVSRTTAVRPRQDGDQRLRRRPPATSRLRPGRPSRRRTRAGGPRRRSS